MSDSTPSGGFIATPRILHFLLLGTAAAAVIFFLATHSIISRAKKSAEIIGRGNDSIPSIVAAQARAATMKIERGAQSATAR